MIRRWLMVLAGLLLAWPVGAANRDTVNTPPGEKRVALVIGNAGYTESPLRNPINDARAMARQLAGIGFEVILREDIKQRQIGATLREFRSRLTPGAEAVFFYAGHGLQLKGINYLPAVDADIAGEEDVPTQSIDVNKVLETMDDAKTRLNLVFLDACRNNPFSRRFRDAGGGLAKMSPPSGTILSFATRPGSVASDGEGSNGLYTQELLKAMGESGVPIERSLKKVHAGVKQASKGKQEPWQEGGIEGEFFFRPGTGSGGQPQQASPSTPGPAPASAPEVAGPPEGNFSLEDLARQDATAKAKWDQWQLGMRAAFDKAAAFDGSAKVRRAGWDRFLSIYAADNPYSTDDEKLRQEAVSRKAAIKDTANIAAIPPNNYIASPDVQGPKNNPQQLSAQQAAVLVKDYYDRYGEWANMFRIESISRIEVGGAPGGRVVAKVRYKYVPVIEKGYGNLSPGFDQRTFTMEYDGRQYVVKSMGGHMSAQFE